MAARQRGTQLEGERRGAVRRLASRDVPTYLEKVQEPGGGPRLIIVERLMRRDTISDEQAAEYVRDARAAAPLDHPNMVRVRGVVVHQDEIKVACDFTDGELLSELWRDALEREPSVPVGIMVRVLIDVLAGLGALHTLRDPHHQRLKLVHGAITADCVLVGLDGASRLLRTCRIRRPGVLPASGLGTIAPEILSGATVDQRADVYSIGVLLWEALSRKRFFPHETAETILKAVQSSPIERPAVPADAAWAAPLADIAVRAMAPAQGKRFPTAPAMATELRKIAGAKLPTTLEVAKFVEGIAGDKIAARRALAESIMHAPPVSAEWGKAATPMPTALPSAAPKAMPQQGAPRRSAKPASAAAPPVPAMPSSSKTKPLWLTPLPEKMPTPRASPVVVSGRGANLRASVVQSVLEMVAVAAHWVHSLPLPSAPHWPPATGMLASPSLTLAAFTGRPRRLMIFVALGVSLIVAALAASRMSHSREKTRAAALQATAGATLAEGTEPASPEAATAPSPPSEDAVTAPPAVAADQASRTPTKTPAKPAAHPGSRRKPAPHQAAPPSTPTRTVR